MNVLSISIVTMAGAMTQPKQQQRATWASTLFTAVKVLVLLPVKYATQESTAMKIQSIHAKCVPRENTTLKQHKSLKRHALNVHQESTIKIPNKPAAPIAKIAALVILIRTRDTVKIVFLASQPNQQELLLAKMLAYQVR